MPIWHFNTRALHTSAVLINFQLRKNKDLGPMSPCKFPLWLHRIFRPTECASERISKLV